VTAFRCPFLVCQSRTSSISISQQLLVGQGLLIIESSRSHWYNTLGRTPLNEWSARNKDLYLTMYRIHKARSISMPPAGIRPAVQTSEWPQSQQASGHSLNKWVAAVPTSEWPQSQQASGRSLNKRVAAVPTSEWPQTHALDFAASGIGIKFNVFSVFPYTHYDYVLLYSYTLNAISFAVRRLHDNSQRHTPAALRPGKTRYPLCSTLGGFQGGKYRPHRDSIPVRPARSVWLYRLSYPGPYRIHSESVNNCDKVLLCVSVLRQYSNWTVFD
jgi:hypothetical protein